jgi:phage tail-like protein
MPSATNDAALYPFTAFNFGVEIEVPGISNKVCSAAFSECDGLEITREVKTIREGGNNSAQVRLPGPLTFGQVTLKRGMTASFDLWDWFKEVQEPGKGKLRGTAQVIVFGPEGESNERVRFVLEKCIPTKIKAPALNAKDGMIAVEEFQMVYETMRMVKPKGGK